MRPIDPRLLRQVAPARRHVALSAGFGGLTAALVVAQAILLATVIARVVAAAESHATEGGIRALGGLLVALGGIVLARAGVAGLQERFGRRAATAVIGDLRQSVVRQVAARGAAPISGASVPGATPASSSSDMVATATLATRGLAGLDGYLTKYLPQLVLACTVTPGVLLVVWWVDAISGLIITLTLPLVPLFMALVGLSTRSSADRALRSLQRLNSQLLDLVAGLLTLRAHGRDRDQVERLRQIGDDHRRLTMRTLRSAFLSSLVLETLTTLSVALVAVGVGLRLVNGDLDLRTGLLALILAPEVYLPLRLVGVHYHASVDGLAAAEQALAILDEPLPVAGAVVAPDLRTASIVVAGLDVVHRGSDRATPSRLDVVLHPGETVALVGPSGCGKSTAVNVLLGLQAPTSGSVIAVPLTWSAAHSPPVAVDLSAIDLATWRRQVAWVPQRPTVVPGTLLENVLLTVPDQAGPADTEAGPVADAARATGFAAVVARLPEGWLTRVGTGGLGLSAGQRQLLALTRALCSGAALVVLDEPTAHLDAASEAGVLRAIRSLREAGRTVLLVAHRPALVAIADRVVQVHDGPVSQTSESRRPQSALASSRTGLAEVMS